MASTHPRHRTSNERDDETDLLIGWVRAWAIVAVSMVLLVAPAIADLVR